MTQSIKGVVGLLASTPTALFPISLGLSGLGAGLQAAGKATGWGQFSSSATVLMVTATLVLCFDIALYAFKMFASGRGVRQDWETAGAANLLAPAFMSAMVIGGYWSENYPLGSIVWTAATIGHLMLIIGFVGRWFSHDFVSDELNPTWFLPGAGIMTAALTWPGVGPIELPLAALSVGSVLWIMLLPIVFRRLVFEPAVSPNLRPTLFIVAAPFGIAAGSLLTLFPTEFDTLALFLLMAGAFFVAVVVSRVVFLIEARLTLRWWATTFPVSTVAAGFLRVSNEPGDTVAIIGMSLLALAAITTLIALIATGLVAWRSALKLSALPDPTTASLPR